LFSQDGNSALHLACANGFKDVAKVLCDSPECNVNQADNSGRTALHWAAASGFSAVVKVLIAAQVCKFISFTQQKEDRCK
jgi:ankyrin repeat protein